MRAPRRGWAAPAAAALVLSAALIVVAAAAAPGAPPVAAADGAAAGLPSHRARGQLRPLPPDRDRGATRIFFVGDTHGDSHCAREWVRRTGVVDLDADPWRWTGSETADVLVFLGDYVDKGPTSRATLEFVRALHTQFPDRVVAVVGNHDLFALLDAMLAPGAARPMGAPVSQYAYSFAHPQEYLEAGWSPDRDDDAELIAAYMSALQAVYAHNLESRWRVPDVVRRAPPFDGNRSLSGRMMRRLKAWEQEYAQGMIDSGLAGWLAELPIVAAVGDALVVHGGVPQKQLSQALRSAGRRRRARAGDGGDDDGERTAHEVLHREANEKFWAWCDQHVMQPTEAAMSATAPFQLTMAQECVLHRGYFGGRRGAGGCAEVDGVLELLSHGPHRAAEQAIRRVVVGHTPDDEVRRLCGGKLLASDSALSRHFRAYGNRYCPVGDSAAANRARAQAAPFTARSGCADPYVLECEGSVAYLERASPADPWPMQAKLVPHEGLPPPARAHVSAAPDPASPDAQAVSVPGAGSSGSAGGDAAARESAERAGEEAGGVHAAGTAGGDVASNAAADGGPPAGQGGGGGDASENTTATAEAAGGVDKGAERRRDGAAGAKPAAAAAAAAAATRVVATAAVWAAALAVAGVAGCVATVHWAVDAAMDQLR